MAIDALQALKISPLMEAVFEMRFQPGIPTAGDVLPGLLFGEMRPDYPTVEQLPFATVPRELREKDPNLLYQATHRLAGASRAIQIGDRVVSLSVTAPYPGWSKFKEAVVNLLESIGRTGLMRSPERFSFRYINVIPVESNKVQLPLLSVRTIWEGHTFSEKGFHLRFELEAHETTTIVQIAPQTTAKSPEKLVSGLLVDVDTLHAHPTNNFWRGDARLLEDSHSILKRIFFSLLTTETLERLGPLYDTATL